MSEKAGSKGHESKADICARTFEFARRIVRLCRKRQEQRGIGRTLSSRLLRSGTSIGANVEEAQGGQSRNDFISKISIARKEARETHYWLRLLAAEEIVGRQRLTDIVSECNGIVAILTAIIKKAKANTRN